jgi:hypothetical protein
MGLPSYLKPLELKGRVKAVDKTFLSFPSNFLFGI